MTSKCELPVDHELDYLLMIADQELDYLLIYTDDVSKYPHGRYNYK